MPAPTGMVGIFAFPEPVLKQPAASPQLTIAAAQSVTPGASNEFRKALMNQRPGYAQHR